MTIGIDVAANPQGAVAAARQITRTFEEMRKAVAAVNGELSKLDSSIRADVEAANAALAQVIKSKLGRGIRQGISTSGQAGVAPLAIDPTRLAATPSAGERMIVQAARVAGIPTGTPPPQPAVPTPAGGSGGIPGQEDFDDGHAPAGGGGGMFRRGAGILRSALGYALPLAGIGSLIGTVAHGVSSAQRTQMDTDTLYRALADLRSTFADTTDKVRRFGDGLALTYDESAKLMTLYARAAGLDSLAATGGARISAGMARAFGLDPAATTAEFGGMRYRGVGGRGAGGDRELAATIAQTIAQSNMFSKSDEVIAALARFTEQASAYFVRTPATEQFARLYGAMNASGQPGLMGRNAESLIGTMDANFRRGGGMGEASKVFLYQALGGGDPFKFRYQLEGGLFDTDGSGKTNFERTMGAFKQHYGNLPKMQRYDALANLFGTNMRQAEAYEALDDVQVKNGNFLSWLRSNGVDLSGARPDSIGLLSQLYKGDDVQGVKRALLENASPDDARRINGATPDDIVRTLAQIAGLQGREQTEGSRVAQSIADLENSITRLGDRLLEPLNRIRDVLSGTLGWIVDPSSDKSSHQVARSLFSSAIELPKLPWYTLSFAGAGIAAASQTPSASAGTSSAAPAAAGSSATTAEELRRALEGAVLTLMTPNGPSQVRLQTAAPAPISVGVPLRSN